MFLRGKSEGVDESMRKSKITVVGAGNTGATTSFLLAVWGLGDIVMVDTPQIENLTQGKALDMNQAIALLGTHLAVKGTSSYADTADSDIVIITAGSPRKPGMSREELIGTNVRIVTNIVEQIVHFSPQALLLILTNPVDILTYVAYKVSGFPKNRVIGQAGVLDTARFRTFIAQQLNIDVNEVATYVLGVHGEEMVPLKEYTFISGIPLSELLAEEIVAALIQRTRKGGEEIVNLLGTGSAYFAPAASLAVMTENILMDKKGIMPVVAYLEGEYGYHDIAFGVPAVLGAQGIEKIVELNLARDEQEALDRSAGVVRQGIEKAFTNIDGKWPNQATKNCVNH
jgi:malate dehydrogenase